MDSERTVMRVGVVQGGRLVEERILAGCRVSVGTGARSTLVIPSEVLPPRWRLFERRRGRYWLRLTPRMQARIGAGGELIALEPGRSLELPLRARGKITVAPGAASEVTILFQLVERQPGPRPQLPLSLRRSVGRELDRPFAAIALVSLFLHGSMIWYLRGVDWPRHPAPEEAVQVIRWPRRPLPSAAPPTPAAAAGGAVRPTLRGPTRPPQRQVAIDEVRRSLSAQVARAGLVQLLTAAGSSGHLADLLSVGSVDRAQEEAFREVSGVRVAEEEGAGRPLGGGVGPGGKLVDVHGLRVDAHISTADVSGEHVERRAPTVRVERPADDDLPPGFDPRLLARVIRDRLGQVRACYEKALKRRGDGQLGGKLVLRFSLTAAGTVSAVEIDEDTLHDPEVAACVRTVARAWRFPAPPRALEVTFPFLFQPSS
jgi:hypothetical protein